MDFIHNDVMSCYLALYACSSREKWEGTNTGLDYWTGVLDSIFNTFVRHIGKVQTLEWTTGLVIFDRIFQHVN